MLHTLTLPSGQVIGSGAEEPALRSVHLTASVGSAVPGGVCAAALEAVLYGQPSLQVGDRLVLSDESGLVGVFFLRSVTVPAAGQLKLEAYDAVAKLDGSADEFLQQLTFPIPLGDLARRLAAWFGLELTGTLLNADLEVPGFLYRGITGRQLMGWICQAGGRFCHAQGDGLQLGWFESSGLSVDAGGQRFYYQGSLEQAACETPPPDQIIIAQTASDVGVRWPEGGSNPLRIEGNPMLTQPGDAAQVLYHQLRDFRFTPCSFLTDRPVPLGALVTVNGKPCAVTTVERTDGRVRVTGTGTAAGVSTPQSSVRALSGRILELQLEVQGLQSRMAQLGDDIDLSQLSQDVDHITAQVAVLSAGEESLGKTLDELLQTSRREFATLSLRSDGLELEVGTMADALEGKADAEALTALTEHFRFDEDGLTISDSRTGMGIGISEEQVVFTGGDPTTRITPTGMTSTDITVENRLRLGDFVLLPRQNGNLSLRWQG